MSYVMEQIHLDTYMDIALSTDVFTSVELGILKEVIADAIDYPGRNYYLFNEHSCPSAAVVSGLEVPDKFLSIEHGDKDRGDMSFHNSNNDVVGFIVFGRTPLTQFSWDIYWLVVRRDFQGKGFGKALIKKVERFIMKRCKESLLKVETSTRKEYAHARSLYSHQGFKEAGVIPDFYSHGDNLIIFYKKLGEEVNLNDGNI